MYVLYHRISQTFIIGEGKSRIALPGNYQVDYCKDTNTVSVQGIPMVGTLYMVEAATEFFVDITRSVRRRTGKRQYRKTVNIPKIDRTLFLEAIEAAEHQVLAILVSDTCSENQCKSTA